MELNNTTTKETLSYRSGTVGHVSVFDRVGVGAIHVETMTGLGWKRLSKPIDDAMINKEGADGGRIPVLLVPGIDVRFVNDGYSSVQVEFSTVTT